MGLFRDRSTLQRPESPKIQTNLIEFEHVTAPRRSWKEAGYERTPEYVLTREQVEAGISYTREKGFNFEFMSNRGKWFSKQGFLSAEKAMQEYRKIVNSGHYPRKIE